MALIVIIIITLYGPWLDLFNIFVHTVKYLYSLISVAALTFSVFNLSSPNSTCNMDHCGYFFVFILAYGLLSWVRSAEALLRPRLHIQFSSFSHVNTSHNMLYTYTCNYYMYIWPLRNSWSTRDSIQFSSFSHPYQHLQFFSMQRQT